MHGRLILKYHYFQNTADDGSWHADFYAIVCCAEMCCNSLHEWLVYGKILFLQSFFGFLKKLSLVSMLWGERVGMVVGIEIFFTFRWIIFGTDWLTVIGPFENVLFFECIINLHHAVTTSEVSECLKVTKNP